MINLPGKGEEDAIEVLRRSCGFILFLLFLFFSGFYYFISDCPWNQTANVERWRGCASAGGGCPPHFALSVIIPQLPSSSPHSFYIFFFLVSVPILAFKTPPPPSRGLSFPPKRSKKKKSFWCGERNVLGNISKTKKKREHKKNLHWRRPSPIWGQQSRPPLLPPLRRIRSGRLRS